ncbi:RNA-binding protein [Alteromonas sp. 345S023]|jgi:RNA recognition motif-containing protein|uniref:RNA-binding protein n=1 Tax=Alteromonas profundi TaxID=2696062 RepID=A0A7X5LNG8_9ALTE|nr:RNA-binding protein [Alteromonas profundi]NDV92586.1 RNA-binding protein [Alteromonas profundi]
MKVGFIQCTIISAVFAIAGYLLFSSANLNTHVPLTVSASLLLGGILTPWLASLLNTSSAKVSSTNSDNVANAITATLYVGNLPYRANEAAVKDYFASFTEVQSVRLMKDRKTGKRKGYGFIEVMTDDIDAVIAKTNDSLFQERTLKVRPAKDKVEHE